MDIESLRKRITTHDYDESGDLSDDINKLAAMGENYRQQLTTLQAEKERLEGELGRYREALNYYANKVQWVKLTEQSEFSIVFIAGQLWDMDGWAVAERALNPEPDFEDGPEFEGWAERAGINEHPTQEPTNGS